MSDEVPSDPPLQPLAIDARDSAGLIVGNSGMVNQHFGDTHNVNINQPLSREEVQNRKNLSVMRQAVRKFWIEGVLNQSLYHEALIRLNMAERADAVDNRPWNLLVQATGEASALLPPNMRILDVFDQMQQRLLILGEPGSGKTTTLLELTSDLLDRADNDPALPTPVVFNLSSWAEHRPPLAEWLVDELRTRYSIPKDVAQDWVKRDALIVLLDGLDEVQAQHREACVQAINDFRQAHIMPLAVCSRAAEYGRLSQQLKLEDAVVLQPLTLEQTGAYLDRAGASLSALRAALQSDPDLREMAESPLLLNIMTLAYQDASADEVSALEGTQTRRQHLFDTYIARMFVRREVKPLFTPLKIVGWLRWLSQRLVQYGQTTFLIERMQPGWMASNFSSRVPAFLMLLWGPIFGLISSIFLNAIFWAIGEPLGVVLTSICGLSIGLSILIASLASGNFKQIGLVGRISKMHQKELITGLIIAAIAVAVYSPFVGFAGALGFGILSLVMALLNAFVFKPPRQFQVTNDVVTNVPNQSVYYAMKTALIFGIVGLVIGLTIGYIAWYLLSLSEEMGFNNRDGLFAVELGSAWLGAMFGSFAGGADIVIKHYLLRLTLWLQGNTPRNYVRFLDHATALIFLRKVGGGYIFVHRLLMEHFAGLSDGDIQRIVSTIPSQPSSTKK